MKEVDLVPCLTSKGVFRETGCVESLRITTLQSLLEALDRRGMTQSERKAFDDAVWEQRGTVAAILVTDLSGFTRLTKKHGVIHFLSIFRRCKTACLPIVDRYDGSILKEEADDLIGVFASPLDAISAGLEMQRVTQKLNETLEIEDDHVNMCIGVEFGKLLRLDDDAFGDTVNVAFKLGEDIAETGEILVGPNAFAAAKAADFDFSGCTVSDKLAVEAGNVSLEHYSVRLRAEKDGDT